MPFAKRSTYTLTLAISAALLSSYAAAEATTPDQEMAWSCNMTNDGEWDCSADEEAVNTVEETEPVQSRSETTSNTAQDTSKAADSVDIQPAPTAIAAPITTVRPEKPQQTNSQNKTNEPITKPPAVAVKPTSNGVWDCVANQAGEWVCNGEEGSTQAIASQPAIKNAQPKPVQTAPAAVNTQPITTAEVIGNEWQCSTSASGDWDCSKVNIHALSVPSGHTNKGPSTPAYITENPYSHLDWAYYRNPVGQQCAGRYLEPEYPITGDEKLDNPPLYFEADKSSTIIGGLSQLSGGVQMRQGQRRLNSSNAELDQVTNKARFDGNVQYREPGLLLLSDNAQVDTVTSEAIFSNTHYVMHEEGLRGSADRIIRLEDERLRMENGDYTYCPPYSEAWQLHADSIVINKKEGYGEAEDAVLRIAGVPIFYTPYFTFPIDDRRKSGFLSPSLGYSGDSGFDISVPYYFNIAPNLDDTLTTRLITDRGLILENELRYMNDWSENTLNTAYINNDKVLDDNRWLLGVQHSGRFANNWHTRLDYTAVSDEDYFDDLDTNLEISRQNHLDKRADISYIKENWQVRARVHDYQTINQSSKSPYKRLPQLRLTGTENFGAGGEFKYFTEYTQFDRNLTGLTGSDRIIGERRFIQPTLNYRWQNPWGYLKPQLRLWSSSYSLENQVSGYDSDPSINVPILSIDSGIYFERAMSNGGTQTLEPRLFALYVPEEDQDSMPDFDTSELTFDYNSLFRTNRFSGLDRIGDAEQLSLGVSTRSFTEDGFEQASFSIGQAYYFADRKIQLDSTDPDETSGQSDIATQAAWNLSPNFRVSLDTILDNSDYKVSESSARLRYKNDTNHRFNFSYRFKDTTREQTDLSFIWPLANNWTGMGRWLYDIQDSDSLETSLGVEYESCCWKVSFAGRRWLDDTDEFDTGIFLKFTLKGLGSFGSGDSSFMDDIIGYEEREEQNED
ncbi:LPS-assembly protein LptD [Neptuniibacter sp. 1_MG-2023]|uniref:LPS-assembly protein LptD n=1 Tax=Neptuniibacter sp. 1_MG-2023 TaxID=3062662 RepID=UPI0026E46C3F|nr:LPS assembly protein LptD [Neptuniibacter sp. 1_MG-2023]MDO6592804.1 LPS assembly protein LptD [Neptuniibacter sp. 1_MG-2023]